MSNFCRFVLPSALLLVSGCSITESRVADSSDSRELSLGMVAAVGATYLFAERTILGGSWSSASHGTPVAAEGSARAFLPVSVPMSLPGLVVPGGGQETVRYEGGQVAFVEYVYDRDHAAVLEELLAGFERAGFSAEKIKESQTLAYRVSKLGYKTAVLLSKDERTAWSSRC